MTPARLAQALMQGMNIEDCDMESKYSNPNDAWYHNRGYDLKSQKNMKGCVFSLAGILIIVVISLLLSSCRSIQYVPVETVKTEYISKTDTFIQKDSVHIKDSVLVFMKGDSVFMDRWHVIYKDRQKEVIRTDTVIKVDSIQVPYPIEKQLSKWQQIKMDAGGIAIGVCFLVIIIVFVGFITKVRSAI